MESEDLRFNPSDARWTWLFKNEAIITEVHLTELTWESQVMITLVHNHKIRCQGDLRLCSPNVSQLEEASINFSLGFKNSRCVIGDWPRVWHIVGIQ